MARLNYVYLWGFVEKKPKIILNDEGEPIQGMAYIHVVRGYRDDHAGKNYTRHDFPLVVATAPNVAARMQEWEANDIVFVKGTISTKFLDKESYCPNEECKDEKGNSTKNISRGILMYVNPIFVKLIKHCEEKKEAFREMNAAKEISNEIYVYGYVVNDPSYFRTKAGTYITQYQIATDRKFRIKADDPTIKTDWPWVKSYGEQAIEDKLRLHRGSEVYIDGVIQARTVHRKIKCAKCGKIYGWEDHTLELVPYDVEYVRNYKTDAILAEEKGKEAEDLRQELFDMLNKDVLTEELNTEDVDESTVTAKKG